MRRNLVRSEGREDRGAAPGDEEEEDAEGDGGVGDVEDAGAEGADADADEVDGAVVEEAVDEVAQAAAGEEREGDELDGVGAAEAEGEGQGEGERAAHQDDEEQVAGGAWEALAEAEEGAAVLRQLEAHAVVEQRDRGRGGEGGAGEGLGDLVATDGAEENGGDQGQADGAGHGRGFGWRRARACLPAAAGEGEVRRLLRGVEVRRLQHGVRERVPSFRCGAHGVPSEGAGADGGDGAEGGDGCQGRRRPSSGSHRQAGCGPWRWTPPSQRSMPPRMAIQSSWPASTPRPAAVMATSGLCAALDQGAEGESRRSRGRGPAARSRSRRSSDRSVMKTRSSWRWTAAKSGAKDSGPAATAASAWRSERDRPSRVPGYSSRWRRSAAARWGRAAVSACSSDSRPAGSGAQKACQARHARRSWASLTGCLASKRSASRSGGMRPR